MTARHQREGDTIMGNACGSQQGHRGITTACAHTPYIHFWGFIHPTLSQDSKHGRHSQILPTLHSTHLHLLHNLLPKGAHLGGHCDGHVLCAAVLTADTIESPWPILDCAVQISLKRKERDAVMSHCVLGKQDTKMGCAENLWVPHPMPRMGSWAA